MKRITKIRVPDLVCIISVVAMAVCSCKKSEKTHAPAQEEQEKHHQAKIAKQEKQRLKQKTNQAKEESSLDKKQIRTTTDPGVRKGTVPVSRQTAKFKQEEKQARIKKAPADPATKLRTNKTLMPQSDTTRTGEEHKEEHKAVTIDQGIRRGEQQPNADTAEHQAKPKQTESGSGQTQSTPPKETNAQHVQTEKTGEAGRDQIEKHDEQQSHDNEETTKRFGGEFKNPAVMMISDVIKYPDHYSKFDAVKVRGKVLAIAQNLILIAYETSENIYLLAVRLPKEKVRFFNVGTVAELEGKLKSEAWTLNQFQDLTLPDKLEAQFTNKYLLEAETGELE